MEDKEYQNVIKSALNTGKTNELLNIIKQSLENTSDEKFLLRDLIKKNAQFLTGLKIDNYLGDFPTFIEPVMLTPGVKIGDTVLLGPNVLIGKDCQLGAFCELTNTILLNNVKLGKLCKLKWCIIDENVVLPEKFSAKECFIRKDMKEGFEIINF